MKLLRRVMPLALFAVIASQAHAQVSDDSSRWPVQIAGSSPQASDSFKKTECHPHQYFHTNLKQVDPQAFRPADDQSSVQQIGTINNFAIVDVVLHFTTGIPPDT